MIDPTRICIAGPLAPYRAALWEALREEGYSPLSSKNLLGVLAHLSRWLEAERLTPGDLTSTLIDEYLEQRRAAGHARWITFRGLDPILRPLRLMGAVPPRELTVLETPLDVLLEEYNKYLLQERGLESSTELYLRVARRFLSEKFDTELLGLGGLRAADVFSFILREARASSIGYAKLKVVALRSLLRYLHVRGLTRDLVAAVPSVAGRRLAGLPKAIAPGEIRKLVKACDRRTGTGRRDFAALLLMVRLGLRAGEVATLRLDDLDWTNGELVIRGKRGREDRLPLPEDVGQAIVSYLERSRPRSTSRNLFLGVRAPHREVCRGTVTAIVSRAGQRAGLVSVSPHRLRHTAATEMLRGGASLSEIGHVLRHRHIDTTAIYAKVDRQRLREVTRPWPGERP